MEVVLVHRQKPSVLEIFFLVQVDSNSGYQSSKNRIQNHSQDAWLSCTIYLSNVYFKSMAFARDIHYELELELEDQLAVDNG